MCPLLLIAPMCSLVRIEFGVPTRLPATPLPATADAERIPPQPPIGTTLELPRGTALWTPLQPLSGHGRVVSSGGEQPPVQTLFS